jgi:outer membrane receptor protein involved in Fe transport
VNRGCETQLLAPCFGSPSDWTPADHEQRWGATGGVVINNGNGGWFSADAEYGSGLSSAACSPAVAFCKYTPHTVFDAVEGVKIGANATLAVRMDNVLNDRYYITLLNAQGNHVSAGRTLELDLLRAGSGAAAK